MLLKLHISAIKSTTHGSATGQLNKAFHQQATCFPGSVALGGETVSLPLGSAALECGLFTVMERKSNLMLRCIMLHCVVENCLSSLQKYRYSNMWNSGTVKWLRLSECEYTDTRAHCTAVCSSLTAEINIQAILNLEKCKFVFEKNMIV